LRRSARFPHRKEESCTRKKALQCTAEDNSMRRGQRRG